MNETQQRLQAYGKILQEYWGYKEFRAGQEEIIEAIVTSPSVLALLTTGGGKSICYQVAGLYLGGLTVVISPLISLMQDQVSRLQTLGLAAALYNSTLTKAQKQEVVEMVYKCELKFLYLSPEALAVESVGRLLAQANVRLVAVDEAHCVSIWGHDFRPAYQSIPSHLRHLPGQLQVAAFTATATPHVRRDIIKHLALGQPKVFVNSFKRDNLRIVVYKSLSPKLLLSLIQERLRIGAVLVYASTRAKAEELSTIFHSAGIDSAHYHGGMAKEERQRVQEGFIANRIRLVCATNAFGMGVDKPDIYTVVHESIPDSLENYFQEAGRAGRDGRAAVSYVNLSWRGVNQRQRMLEDRYVSRELANSVYNYLRQRAAEAGRGKLILELPQMLKQLQSVNRQQIFACLEVFAQSGIIRSELDQATPRIELDLVEADILLLSRWVDFRKLQRLYEHGREKLKALVQVFLEEERCRMAMILEYFGETSGSCQNCDNCLAFAHNIAKL